MPKSQIGFIGIGAMGAPMARQIHTHGYPLTIFDVDHDKTDGLATEIGCRKAASLADLGGQCGIIITMLPNGDIVRDVMLSNDGVASTLPANGLLVDMSSSEPAGTRHLGKMLAERGIDLVDAPVSGGIRGAETGALSIMIGSDSDAALERAMPVLETMGSNLTVAGPLGAGHAAKALNNLLGALNLVGTAEVLVMSQQFGLDPGKIFAIINKSTGRSMSTELFAKRWQDISAPVGFSLALMAKDVGLATGMAEQVNIDAPLAKAVNTILTDACERLGAADVSDFPRYLRMINGLERPGD